jgi:RNA-directed DNA polymerase
MIAQVMQRKNLYKAYRQVVHNGGASGVDGMTVTELFSYIEKNRDRVFTSILNHTYVAQAIRGWKSPKQMGKLDYRAFPR